MSKVQIPLVMATIRRDANTITTVGVPVYELPILKLMFGKEHVVIGQEDGQIEVDAAEEFKRLCSKYGREKIVRVYGDDDGDRLTEVVERAGATDVEPKRQTMSLRGAAIEGRRSGPAAAI